jgi:ppGpp synthetase/RelA/SpoT-type nucleotidyltranferase
MARRKRRFNPTLSAFGDIRATAEHYPAIFGDYDKDGIFDVDDPTPYKYSKSPDTIEEVKLSDEIRHLIDIRNQFESVKNQVIFDLEGLGGHRAYGRTKTPFSTINKLRRKRLLGAKGLTDIAGTTVLAVDFPHLQHLKKAILSGQVGEVIEHENFYRTPLGGYRAHHFIVEREGLPIEIQLKTIRMADSSKASHTPYKSGKLNTIFMGKLTALANEADKGKKSAQVEFAKLTRDKKKLKEKLTIRRNTMAKTKLFRNVRIGEDFFWDGTWFRKKSTRTAFVWGRPKQWHYFAKDDRVQKEDPRAQRKNPHGEVMFNMHQIDEIRPLKSGGASLFKWNQGKMAKVGELTKDQFQEYQFSGGRRYQDGNWHTNPRRRNAKRVVAGRLVDYPSHSMSGILRSENFPSHKLGGTKLFLVYEDGQYVVRSRFQDFYRSHKVKPNTKKGRETLERAIKKFEDKLMESNPRRRNVRSQHKVRGAHSSSGPWGFQTKQALLPYKSNSRRRRNSGKYYIHVRYSYYPGTFNVPKSGALSDNYYEKRYTFPSVAAAKKFLKEELGSLHQVSPQSFQRGGRYVLSHGEYSEPLYSIRKLPNR